MYYISKRIHLYSILELNFEIATFQTRSRISANKRFLLCLRKNKFFCNGKFTHFLTN